MIQFMLAARYLAIGVFSTSFTILAVGCAARYPDDEASRYEILASKNEDFGEAVRLLESMHTPEGKRRIAASLERALSRRPMSNADESIIKTLLAVVHLPGVDAKGVDDCRRGKEYSSSALALDPKSIKALQTDIAADYCLANASGAYDALIGRLEGLRREGKHYPGLYSMLSIAYEERSERTGTQEDLLKAREAWNWAQRANEPILGDAWKMRAEHLDEKLRERKSPR
jgi:hypothetical protein